ncbi:hypothetical protein SYN65AY6LI_00950 [Synechococcus sp. 65AY6Li]|nr:hypothetical protein SYN65AY6LI_00950 [Synechococcus sp. 65AY6Li]
MPRFDPLCLGIRTILPNYALANAKAWLQQHGQNPSSYSQELSLTDSSAVM